MLALQASRAWRSDAALLVRALWLALGWAMVFAVVWLSLTPSPPEVDFEDEMVVLVSMGTRPSTGYYIELQEATWRGDRIEVRVVAVSPGRGCGVGDALTYPADLARMPRTDLPVRFTIHQRVSSCG
jgi:hypothetical protein